MCIRDSRFVKPFLHSGVLEAYEETCAAVDIRTPFVGVCGAPGCGRSTIATAALAALPGAAVVDLSASDGDVVAAAAVMLRGRREELPRLLVSLEAPEIIFLLDGPGNAKAAELPDQLLLLLQLAARPAVFLLAGSRETVEKPLADERITVRQPVITETSPMRPDETAGYLAHRLAEAGLIDDLFEPDAATFIGTASAGVPAAINAVARRSLAAAWVAGSRRVGMQEVSSAVTPAGSDIDGP